MKDFFWYLVRKPKNKSKTRNPETRRERRKKPEGTEEFRGVTDRPTFSWAGEKMLLTCDTTPEFLRSLRLFPPFPPRFKLYGFDSCRNSYRNFRVVSANSANTSAAIQKRIMIFDSDQPTSSK